MTLVVFLSTKVVQSVPERFDPSCEKSKFTERKLFVKKQMQVVGL